MPLLDKELHRERMREQSRQRRLDPLWKADYAARRKAARYHLKNLYGITPERYDYLFKTQDGVCANCQQPETLRIKGNLVSLAVDHDHVTGEVRGLLCSNCNQGLGKFKHDPALLRAAADYLEGQSRGTH